MGIDRMVKRREQKRRMRTCEEKVKAWRQRQRQRAAKDPKLADLEDEAFLILRGLLDPTKRIPSEEEARRILRKCLVILGEKIPPPDCFDPRKDLQEVSEKRNLNPASRSV